MGGECHHFNDKVAMRQSTKADQIINPCVYRNDARRGGYLVHSEPQRPSRKMEEYAPPAVWDPRYAWIPDFDKYYAYDKFVVGCDFVREAECGLALRQHDVVIIVSDPDKNSGGARLIPIL